MRILVFLINIFLFLGWVVPGGEAQTPFRKALPGYSYQFPRDFFSHDDYRVEWWYYTGNLKDAGGNAFGYQLTFFRVALDPAATQSPSKWSIDQIYFAHLTVTDGKEQKFHFFERINRKAMGQAGAASDQLKVWNEDWKLTGEGSTHHLVAQERGTGLDLKLTPLKPLVIHGKRGVSQKGDEAGNASHYFSYPRMRTEGFVFIDGNRFEVTGTSWMDHEFSSNQLSPKQIGWDWFSIKLDNNEEIMLYLIRLEEGGVEPFSSGTWVRKDGSSQHLMLSDFKIQSQGTWTSPDTGAVYPSGWQIRFNDEKDQLQITPEVKGQELHHLRSIGSSYWEGSVTVEGEIHGQKATGKGYVELVGYQKRLKEQLPE